MRQAKEILSPSFKAKGVDGLNLVEFPISVLSNRAPRNTKTLEFCERRMERGKLVEHKLSISGSDKYGLPTYRHHDILIGLMQLTWRKHGASSPRVEFTRYELLKLLGWATTGVNYRRIEQAIDVWMGTTFYYKDSWWVDGSFKSKTFNVLADAEIYGTKNGGARKRTSAEFRDRPSYFVWGTVPFEDFQAKRTKGLDYQFYQSLNSAVSKQLYRHLDKWFHYDPRFEHGDLRTFACEKIGLSRRHDNSNLMRELERGVSELVERGYLKDTGRSQRYHRTGNVYRVSFERVTKTSQRTRALGLDSEQEKLVQELEKRGVRNSVRADLVKSKPAEFVRAAIENFDDRLASGESLSPAYLVAAIRSDEGYAFRKDYEPPQKKKKLKEATNELNAAKESHSTLKKELERLRDEIPVAALESLSGRHQDMLLGEAIHSSDSILSGQICSAKESGSDARLKLLERVAVTKLCRRVKPAVESGEDSRAAAIRWIENVESHERRLKESDIWQAVVQSQESVKQAERRLRGIRDDRGTGVFQSV